MGSGSDKTPKLESSADKEVYHEGNEATAAADNCDVDDDDDGGDLVLGRGGDVLQHVLDDEGEGSEAADDQEVGDGTLDSLSLVPLQGLPGGETGVHVAGSQSAVGGQLLRGPGFLHLQSFPRLLRLVRKEFAECAALEVELVTLCRQRPLVCVGGLDGPEGGAFLEHERQQAGQDGGHGPGRVPGVRVIVGAETRSSFYDPEANEPQKNLKNHFQFNKKFDFGSLFHATKLRQ